MDYKDSRISWIGPIPTHWEVVRGKNVLKLLNRPVREHDEIVTCFHDGTVTRRADKTDRRINLSTMETGYQGVEPRDLVVHSMDASNGAIGISDSRGKATPVLLVLDSMHNKRYLMYYLRMVANRNVFQTMSDGIRNHSCDLTWRKLAVFPFLLPSRAEQDQIAEYLDHTLGKIDAIIAEAQESIEDYRHWKAVRIYEVLTKGLDAGATMKDSGIPWIGKIPADWSVQKLKTLVRAPLRQGTLESGVAYDPDLPRYIRSADIAPNGTLKDDNKRSLSGSVTQKYLLEDGDLLFIRSGETVGRACIYRGTAETATWASYLIRARIDNKIINPKLVYYATLAANYDDWKTSTMTSAVVKNISASKYSDWSIVVPPIAEQEQLVRYIEDKILPVDDLISQRKALIADLLDYKQSLIFEAVTGQIIQ